MPGPASADGCRKQPEIALPQALAQSVERRVAAQPGMHPCSR
jgi:hypothetical protein